MLCVARDCVLSQVTCVSVCLAGQGSEVTECSLAVVNVTYMAVLLSEITDD